MFCSRLAMRGAASKAIQELAGHHELSVTQRDMHLSPGAADSAIRLLESSPVPPRDGDILETTSEGGCQLTIQLRKAGWVFGTISATGASAPPDLLCARRERHIELAEVTVDGARISSVIIGRCTGAAAVELITLRRQ